MLLHELKIQGILSFGPAVAFPLRPLNVLVGPNGSGKSNLVEALDLLRSSPTKLTAPIRAAGGAFRDWLWKGPTIFPEVEAVIKNTWTGHFTRHRIEFNDLAQQLEVLGETITTWDKQEPRTLFEYLNVSPVLFGRSGQRRGLRPEELAPDESILSQIKDPFQYPELDRLGKAYASIRSYREWSFGIGSVLRKPQPADMPSGRLAEDFSNLALFLNRLRGNPPAKRVLIERLRDLYDGIDDFHDDVKGNTVEIFLTEGDHVIPASRLSDGTLRYLCLLAILCDPEPPPLICIEEPELGLHPDLLPTIADLLVEASARTQLIVTTHSDIIVDALSEQPESVVVVEKHEGATQLRRLEATAELKQWLERYRLGELWIRGEIGGKRW